MDRYYDGVDDVNNPEPPVAPYDREYRELDFNDDPETEYLPETDEDWAGPDEDAEDDEETYDEEFD